jgi:hypothetical protein
MAMSRRSRRLLLAGGAWIVLGMADPAGAQPIPDDARTASVLDLPRPGYESRNVQFGNVVLEPQLNASATYDSNIYAAHTNRRNDVVFRLQPVLTFRENNGGLQWRAEAYGELRRYASTTRENSETYGVTGAATLAASRSVTINAAAGYRRAVENRSDPEVEQNPTLGPPLFDLLNGELAVSVGKGRFGFSLKGEVERYDFVSSFYDDRDFTSYRGTLRVLGRLTPAFNGFVQGYINQREFRIREPGTGVNRNGRTLGGLVGVQIDPGGKIRGDIGAGVFHYDPADASLKGFSGFALQGSLIYTPRARTALILDAFNGDVATVRSGARGRIDTRIHFGVEQEVRHNLLAKVGARFRQSRYRGVDQKLTTWGGDGEIEYLMNRHVSLALTGEFTKRTAGSAPDRFERFRVGAVLRLRY